MRHLNVRQRNETTGAEAKLYGANVQLFDEAHVPEEFAKNWALVRRVPVSHGRPLPKAGCGPDGRTAKICLTYFRPCALVKGWACKVLRH